MKRMLLVLALALGALAATGTATAGGWATVKLSSTPDGASAGEPWMVEITVLRHGRTPTDGAKPRVVVRSASGERISYPAAPTGKKGVYRARVVFTEAGTWRWSVSDGLAATGYGISRTHTFSPVEVA